MTALLVLAMLAFVMWAGFVLLVLAFVSIAKRVPR